MKMHRNGLLLVLPLLALAPLAKGGPTTQPKAPPTRPAPNKPIKPVVVPPKEQAAPPKGPDHPKDNNDPRVYFQYGNLDYTSTDERLTLTKSDKQPKVIFEYKDTIFKSDKVLYDRNTKVASAPTPVQMDDAQNTITGERGTAYYKLTTTKIEGNVIIVARPKPANPQSPAKGLRKDFDSPVEIHCDRVTYNWKTKIAIPEGNIRILFSLKRKGKQQKWNVTSDTMEYNGNTETAFLRENVKGRADDGDKADGDTGTVILKETKEELKMTQAKGSFDSDKIDEEDDKKATPPPTVEKKTGDATEKNNGSGSDRVE
ncbi:MAG: hypothetical protein QM758_10720 [Armatimonas sp.]